MMTTAGMAMLAATDATQVAGGPAVGLQAWAVFLALVGALLVVDLKLVMREPHAVSTREAAWYSAAWITVGVAFAGLVWVWLGGVAAQEYLTGYLIEAGLSVDNLVVWAALFAYFAVPAEYQHQVLFSGVVAAIVLRLAVVFAGVALLDTFGWIVYVFAAFLLYTAVTMLRGGALDVDPEHRAVLSGVRRWLPRTEGYLGDRFLVRRQRRWMATPLLTALVAIELTDVLFAIDSIPAVLAFTTSEFVVFSSNVFAVLGVRALYFVLAGLRDRLVHLDRGLGVVLLFAAVQFVLQGLGLDIPTSTALLVVATVLAVTLWSSWRRPGGPVAADHGAVTEATDRTGGGAVTDGTGDGADRTGDGGELTGDGADRTGDGGELTGDGADRTDDVERIGDGPFDRGGDGADDAKPAGQTAAEGSREP
jgi:tellurite resistance protein TerC